jgi:hypothetical protein
MVWWSDLLTTNREVPGSIPDSAVPPGDNPIAVNK